VFLAPERGDFLKNSYVFQLVKMGPFLECLRRGSVLFRLAGGIPQRRVGTEIGLSSIDGNR